MRDIYNEDQSPGTPEAKQNFFQCLAGCGPSQNYFNFINLIPSRLGPGCCPLSCFTLQFLCIISCTLYSLVLLFVLYSKSWHNHIWTASCYLYVKYNTGFFFYSIFSLLLWCCMNDLFIFISLVHGFSYNSFIYIHYIELQ